MKISIQDSHSFWDHVEEFRWRLLWIIGAWIIGFFICFPFSIHFIEFASRPVGRLVFLSPTEAFSVRIHVSFLLATVIISPVWVYHILRFLWTGLKENERRGMLLRCALILMLAYVGVVFAHKILVPVSIKFIEFWRRSVEANAVCAEFLIFLFWHIIVLLFDF